MIKHQPLKIPKTTIKLTLIEPSIREYAKSTMNLPVAYNGTECVKKPPAATTQQVCSRRTSSLALSGVS